MVFLPYKNTVIVITIGFPAYENILQMNEYDSFAARIMNTVAIFISQPVRV